MERAELRDILKEAGVENPSAAVNQIMKINGEDIEIAKKNAKVDTTKFVEIEKYNQLQNDYDDLKKNGIDSKEFERLQKFEQDTKANQTRAKKEQAVTDLLKENKASDKALKLLLKGVDLEKVELDESGKIKDGKSIVDTLKGDYADFFIQEQKGGAHPGNPGGQGGDPKITKEQFAKMSYTERMKLYNDNKELYDQLKQ